MANKQIELLESANKLLAVEFGLTNKIPNAQIEKIKSQYTDFEIEEKIKKIYQKLSPDPATGQVNRPYIFQYLGRMLDEVRVANMYPQYEQFADIETVPQGSQPMYRQTTGRERAIREFVTRKAMSGAYQTFRLDEKEFHVPTFAIGGASIIDYERYLDGRESISRVLPIINEGIDLEVSKLIQETMLAAWSNVKRRALQKVTFGSFDPGRMDQMIQDVKHITSAVSVTIYTSYEFASEMANLIKSSGDLYNEDFVDIRNQGYIGTYKGNPVVVLRNSYTDTTYTELQMNPRIAFVIPNGREKIVKLFYEGGTHILERQDKDWSTELYVYIKCGAAVVSDPTYWGMYQNTGISAPGWQTFS